MLAAYRRRISLVQDATTSIIEARTSLRSLLLMPLALVAVIGTASPGTSFAEEVLPPSTSSQTFEFNIPAQPLASALHMFADLTGYQVSIPAKMAEGVTSAVVSGSYSPEQGLATLLAGTGLTYRFTKPRVLTLVRDSSGNIMPAGVGAGAAGAVAGESETIQEPKKVAGIQKPVKVPEILVKDVTEKNTALLGPPPAEYAGGQVATGGQVGLLGNRDLMNTPFSQTNYTEKLVRDQQARTVTDVLMNDPSVRINLPRYSEQDQYFIRGFRASSQDMALGGLFGIVDVRRPNIESVERVEVLRGPSTLLYGVPTSGFIGGTINLIPKRATDAPITRLIGSYASDSNLGGWLDVGRRYGDSKEFGVRFNSSYYTGDTPTDGQWYNRGVSTIGLDYTKDRLRLSLDVGYQSQRWQRMNRGVFVNPGFQIPDAPDAMRNFQQPWEKFESQHAYGLARAEYDLLPNLTAFTSYGRAQTWEKFDGVLGATLLNRAGDIRFAPPGVQPGVFLNDSAQAGIRSIFSTGPIAHKVSAIGSGLWRTIKRMYTPIGGPIFSNMYVPTDAAEPARIGVDVKTHMESSLSVTSLALADELSILDERVQLIAGVRGQRIETGAFNTTTGVQTASYDKTAVTPAVGLVVRPWQVLSLYASYIEGLTPGPTAPVGSANLGEVFAPFVAKQYEVGTKLDLNGVGATFALFQITQQFGFTNPATNVFGVEGEQRNRGMELTVFGTPTEGVRLLGGGQLIKGTQTKTVGGVNDGKAAPGVPDIQLSLYAEYDFPWVKGLTLTGRALYTSSQYHDAANSQSIPYWTRFDAGTRYAFVAAGRPLVVRFNVENIANNNYWQSTGGGFLSLGMPRTVLLSLQADF